MIFEEFVSYSPWIILYTLGLITSIDVIMGGRTAQGTVAWVLALILLPMIALPLYLIFGDRKFFGYIRARRSGKLELDLIAKQLHQALIPHHCSVNAYKSTQKSLEALSDLPFTQGNNVQILQDGNQTYSAMLETIDKAQKYILLQSYILRDDCIGQIFKQKLIKLSHQGIKVYVLYDEIGSNELPTSFIQELITQGIAISQFNSNKGRNKLRINFRNHRKLLIVDGHTGFAGGLNIGDEYLGKMPDYGSWRDTHCRVQGPVIQAMQLSFVEDWHWSTQQILELNWHPEIAENCIHDGINALVMATGPADALETCSLFFVQMINQAKTRLWLVAPYFVPDQKVLAAIQLAALRGVDVRIILPGESDAPWVLYSSLSFLPDLFQVGVKVFQYQPGIMHQKVMLIDNELSTLGTANLDNRSLRINFELTLVFHDKNICNQIKHMLQEDLQHCVELTQQSLDDMGFVSRFLSRLSRLFAPVQ